MQLEVGNTIVYPNQGPCLIQSIVERMVMDKPMSFYQLLVLDEEGGNLFVPVEKALTIGIRRLLDLSAIPRLLTQLQEPAQPATLWKQRAADNQKLFASGSAFDLATVIQSLTQLSLTKSLSFGESKTLERAKKLLIGELAEVLCLAKEKVEAKIDQALAACPPATRTSTTATESGKTDQRHRYRKSADRLLTDKAARAAVERR